MEKKIPTTKIKVKDTEIEIYQWLTQEESDQYLVEMGIGEKEMEVGANTDARKDLTFKVSMSSLSHSRNYRLKCVLVSPTFEDFNSMEPSLRDAIVESVDKFLDKKK